MSLERQLAEYGQHLRKAIGDIDVPIAPGEAVRPVVGEPAPRRAWWGPAVAGAALAATLAVALPLLLLTRGSDEEAASTSQTVTSLTPTTSPSSTMPGVTPLTGWESVVYGEEEGVPQEGVTGVLVDDGGFAFAVAADGNQLRILERTAGSWVPMGDPLPAPYCFWAAAEGGQVILAVPAPGGSGQRIVRNDNGIWSGYEDAGLVADFEVSTVVRDPAGRDWIVGYRAADKRLVVAQLGGGSLDSYVAEEAVTSMPSVFTVAETVAVGPDGAIWIANPAGVWHFADGAFDDFSPLPQSGCCHTPVAVEAGSVWVVLENTVYQLEGREWVESLIVPAPERGAVGPILATPDGSVWVFTRDADDALYRFDGSAWTSYTREEANALGYPTRTSLEFVAVEAADGSIVTVQFATDGTAGRVHRFADAGWQQFPSEGLQLAWGDASADRVRGGVGLGPDGSIWLPVAGGIGRLLPPGAALLPDAPAPWEEVAYLTADGLPAGGTRAVTVAEDGTAWAAAWSDSEEPAPWGVQLFRFDGTRWVAAGDPLDVPRIEWMIPDGAGGIVAGSYYDHGIYRFDGSSWTRTNPDADALEEGGASTVVAGPDGAWWIVGHATTRREFAVTRVADGDLDTYSTPAENGEGLAGNTIRMTVDAGPDGSFWVALQDRVIGFKDGEITELALPDEAAACCFVPVAIDLSGTAWVVLADQVYRQSGQGWSLSLTLPGVTDGDAGPILATPDGSVWVFTGNSEGSVHRFDGSAWVSFTEDEARALGYPTRSASVGILGFYAVRAADGTITFLEIDPGPHAWVYRFTDEGWQRVSGSLVAATYQGAGIASGGIAVGPDGAVWVPTSDGVVRLIPPG